MATTAPAAKDTRAVTDLEAYQIVAKVFSKTIADQVIDALKKLQDPHVFDTAVRSLGREQGREEVESIAPIDLYNGFWSLYNGCFMDLNWANDSAVPPQTALIVENLEPTQQPVSLDKGQPRGFGFGVDLGPFSFHVGV
ncbi:MULTISPECIES: hypothetical protein [Streptomyces]|jgi:hypothetical protein|uniref:hypothetical protein n=1 Tax=Streptomyces TaxID=1883 RepID=UPI00224C9F7C|nr:hypothetical protein [Streptomyces viridodiastaticus]MCX4624755.1 hypothetical protein [Streptomyces viridodiastaticus]